MATASAIRKMEDVRDTAAKKGQEGGALRQVEEKAENIRHAAVEEISSLMTALNEKVRALGIETDEWVDSARDKALAIERSVVREVAERPLRALAFAALAGWALGFVTRR